MGDHVALKLYPGQPRGPQGQDTWHSNFLLLFPSLADKSLLLALATPVAGTPLSQAPDISFPSDASHRAKPKAVSIRKYSKDSLKTSFPLTCCNQLGSFFHGLQWPEGLGFSHLCLQLGVITCSIFFSNTSDHSWVRWFQPFTEDGSSSRWAGLVHQSQLLTCRWTGLCFYSLSFRTSTQRIQATLCRTELLQGRDGKIPNLHPNAFKTLKVLRLNSLV